MPGEKAASAEHEVRKLLEDQSGSVQVAAAKASARLGKAAAALQALERWLQERSHLTAIQ